MRGNIHAKNKNKLVNLFVTVRTEVFECQVSKFSKEVNLTHYYNEKWWVGALYPAVGVGVDR